MIVPNDRIQLDNAIFTGLADGAVLSTQFEFNTSGLATKTTTRLIYETDTGELYYDSNGSKAGGVYQQFATISPNLVMNEGEFWVI